MTAATVHPLTDGVAMRAMLRGCGLDVDHVEPCYLRHKPGASTIVAYRMTGPDGVATWGHARRFADADEANRYWRKSLRLRPRPASIGPGVARPEPHLVVHVFPNDPGLRRLRWYLEPRKLKRSLADLAGPGERIRSSATTNEVLRYKPGRRLVTELRLGGVEAHPHCVLRYTRRPRAEAFARIARILRERGVATPEPIAQLEAGRVAIDRFVEGVELRSAVRRCVVPVDGLANAIVRLQSVPPELLVAEASRSSPPATGTRTFVDDAARARCGLHGLVDLQPQLATLAAEVSATLVAAIPDEALAPVIVHGDFHDKNVLVTPVGGIVLIDLDRLALGHPAIDLGYLRAHAEALGVRDPDWSPTAVDVAEQCIDAVRRRCPIEASALSWYTALGLVEQAIVVSRQVDVDALRIGAELLEAALGHLRRPSLVPLARRAHHLTLDWSTHDRNDQP